MDTQTDQYLTFTLDGESFAVEISRVREVVDYMPITRVPRVPPFLKGVINLRGSVVAVIDLRLVMGMTAFERTVDSCIVIVEIAVDGETLQLGMLADSVQEVVDIEPGQIFPPPAIGARVNTEFIQGIGKKDERFMLLLDINKVLEQAELRAISGLGAEV